MIYNTKVIKEGILKELKGKVDKIKKGSINPTLALIRIGQNQGDISYEKALEKSAAGVGISIKKHCLELDVSTEQVESLIYELNVDSQVGGILIFRPLPASIDEERINRAIDPLKDVDCISPVNQVKLLTNEKGKLPATSLSAHRILKDICTNLEGKNIFILNRSMVIGKPLAHMLLRENATVTIGHSKTKNIKDLMRQYEVVILGTGQAQMIDSTYISKGAIVIDCGISFKDGKLCGDANVEDLEEHAGWITPVPGGVGALTNLLLLDSVLEYFQ